MAYFQSKASEVFPIAKWTGGSYIHASIAKVVEAQVPFSSPRLVMKTLMNSDFLSSIYRFINKQCPGMEWLMSQEDFNSLLLVDFHRLLSGFATLETNYRLRNPVTQNLFHRISLMPAQDMVGGIRVWVMPNDEDSVQLGFRFRLESINGGEEEHVNVRKKSAAQVVEVLAEMENIKEFVSKEVAEPVAVPEVL